MKLEAHGRSVDITWDDKDDHIPRRIRETQDFYERAMLDDCYDRAPDGLIVDAGAHIGSHTLFFAGIMRRQVRAFEPNPLAYRQLKANIKLNNLGPRVQTYRAALGFEGGWGKLRNDKERNTSATRVMESEQSHADCMVIALDDLRFDPAVIKVDVEGAALAVLRGAAETLERAHPLLYVEVLDDLEAITAFLACLGYEHRGWMGATPVHVFEAG